MQAIGFLLMGLSGLGLVGGGALVFYAVRTDRIDLAKYVGLFALGWAALYLVVLAGASLTSQETVLGLKERKAFCGFYLDCHVGVSVEDVQRVAHLGEGAGRVQADGVFYLVTVRVSSDAVNPSISLSLKNPKATLVDDAGATYGRSLDAERVLAEAKGVPVAFARSVSAGDSYAKTLVFDVPSDVRAPKLLVTQGVALDRLIELFLIGDEDSLFHRKTVFAV
jgi:hypothetical protein